MRFSKNSSLTNLAKRYSENKELVCVLPDLTVLPHLIASPLPSIPSLPYNTLPFTSLPYFTIPSSPHSSHPSTTPPSLPPHPTLNTLPPLHHTHYTLPTPHPQPFTPLAVTHLSASQLPLTLPSSIPLLFPPAYSPVNILALNPTTSLNPPLTPPNH